jgi:hypothetical protein
VLEIRVRLAIFDVDWLWQDAGVKRLRARTRRAVITSVSSAILASSSLALAEAPARIELAWDAPVGCPTREVVLARVEQLLGESSTSNDQPLDVRASITLQPDGTFRAALGTPQAGTDRLRTLEAATCVELAEASAVVIALVFSPAAMTERIEGPAQSPPPREAPTAAGEVVPSEVAPSGRRGMITPSALRGHAQLRLGVSAGVAADVGTIAAVAPGLMLQAGAHYGTSFEFAVRGSYFPDRSSTVAAQPNKGADIQLGTLATLACFFPIVLPVELGLCGELELGYLHARGFGTAFDAGRGAWWLAPGAGLSAAYPARGRFRSRFNADALFPIARTEFLLTNVGSAHQLPAISPRFGFCLELVFL